MQSFKTKSLSSSITDQELANKGGYAARFISFEAAIRLFQEKYDVAKEKPIGYKVTEQGIEIIYE